MDVRRKYSDRYDITDVSHYYLADEISRSHFATEEMVDAKHWGVFAAMTRSQFTSFLKEIARSASLARYRKHMRGPTKPKPKRKFTGARHQATQKYLEARK